MKNSMQKWITITFVLISILSVAFKEKQDNGLTVDEYFKMVQNKDSAVFVYFSADWCMPCVKSKIIISELENENPKVKFIKLDVDANPQIALHFEINTLPLFLIYKNKKQVWSNNTFMYKNDLQAKLRFYQ